MCNVDKAREIISRLPTSVAMCAYDIIGREYLDGETVYMNHVDGIESLIGDSGLSMRVVLDLMLGNRDYSNLDEFIVFDGKSLFSCDYDYLLRVLSKKMNGECAEFILGCPH